MAISKTVKGSLFFIERSTGTDIDESHFFEQITEFLEFYAQMKLLGFLPKIIQMHNSFFVLVTLQTINL